MTKPHLFSPLTLRGVTLRNRIGVSPMCMYSCVDGMATDWHLVHLGSRATGGAGLVMMEATAVTPEGRISPLDHGLWSDAHIEPLKRITAFIKEHGAVPGVQLAHAGRKASTWAPWDRGNHPHSYVPPEQGGWQVLAPSAETFAPGYGAPRAMTVADIEAVIRAWEQAARRALAAGFEWLEVHAAHGYLLHTFLSPLGNHRTDAYGGSAANRHRLVEDVVRAVRRVWPADKPLSVRLSVTDWVEGGWDLPDSITLSQSLRELGTDLIDCSSGAIVPHAAIPVGANYQVPFAEAIRRQARIATAAVGMIREPMQADAIVRQEQADVVLMAREMLRHPAWPSHAALALGHPDPVWPKQYGRGFP